MENCCERWLTIDADKKTLMIIDRILRFDWHCIEKTENDECTVYGDYQLNHDTLSPELMVTKLSALFPKAALSLQIQNTDGSFLETVYRQGKPFDSFTTGGLPITG